MSTLCTILISKLLQYFAVALQSNFLAHFGIPQKRVIRTTNSNANRQAVKVHPTAAKNSEKSQERKLSDREFRNQRRIPRENSFELYSGDAFCLIKPSAPRDCTSDRGQRNYHRQLRNRALGVFHDWSWQTHTSLDPALLGYVSGRRSA